MEVCAAPFKLLGDVDVGGVDVVCVGAGFVLPPPPPLQLLLELTVVEFVVVIVVLFVVASIVAVVDVGSGPFRRGGDVFGWFVGVVADAVGTAIVGALLVGVVADAVVGVVVVVVVVVVVGGDFCWFSRLGLDTGPIMPFFEKKRF